LTAASAGVLCPIEGMPMSQGQPGDPPPPFPTALPRAALGFPVAAAISLRRLMLSRITLMMAKAATVLPVLALVTSARYVGLLW
jgi:hypothetical protein